MTTSGQTSFNQTVSEIVTRALRMHNAFPRTGTPDAALFNETRLVLNTLNRDLQQRNIFLWTQTEETQALTPSTSTYSLDDKYDSINKAWLRKDNVDYKVDVIGYNDYLDIDTKSYEGVSTRLAITPALSNRNIVLYPVPDSTDYTLHYIGIKLLDDLISNSDNAEFPASWLNVLTYGLAFHISAQHGASIQKWNKLQRLYEKYLEQAKSSDEDDGVLFMRGAYSS